jgi:diguanylate cyclase (GGDEF)-like protein
VRLRTATDREIWAELSWRALEMNDQRCLVVGVRDVTDKKIADERLHQLATTDPLTGALNRHSFFEVAGREIARSARYAHPLAVVMFDADHFKQLNDRRGHAAGDEALRTIVRVARRELRRVDTLARVGGEEFAVVLPETPIEAATRVTERLRQAIADEPLSDGERVTISAGVVAWSKDDSLDTTLGRADKAMYEAKHAGRNRVHSSP